ncbi:cellulase N-terminal Ig-like domain-containing protein [Humibacillus sp. DSM 29435]|uniref:cellulase N-terminal Ig-like domain-containing protein n=1 Tax=Humibacillus sp. DSM 29435 TaxID=1869167 RepID=UPI0020C7D811|nr:cellulase N-terminal Ig-like domain-containing protein [Humibacillus sp. DSM 29435]
MDRSTRATRPAHPIHRRHRLAPTKLTALATCFGLTVTTAMLAPATIAGADPGPEQITNGTFDTDLLGWNAFPSASVVDGRGCVDVPAGTAPYQAGLLQEVPMVAGEIYAFHYEALTVPATTAEVRVLIQGGPDINYAEFLPSQKHPLTPDAQAFDSTFTADRDYPNATVAFQQDITNAAAYRLCLDNVSLTGGAAPATYVPDTGPAVRVNQVGYLTGGPKEATVVTDAKGPQQWLLRDARGVVVRRGLTHPEGMVSSAGVKAQTISFDSFRRAGAGYTLTVGDQTSYPFAIGSNLYEKLRTQSKTF